MPSLLSEIMCFSLVCIWCSSTVESHYNKYLGHYKFFTLSEIYCIQLTFYNRTFTWAHVIVSSFHCLCIAWVETCLLFAYFYAFEWLVFKISIGIKHRKNYISFMSIPWHYCTHWASIKFTMEVYKWGCKFLQQWQKDHFSTSLLHVELILIYFVGYSEMSNYNYH
jgi:hypothetical protein